MLRPDLDDVYVAVVSHLRSSSVPKIVEKIGEASWYVGKGEAQAYESQGAQRVHETGTLCDSRNRALEDAFEMNVPCLQISDDLKRLRLLEHEGPRDATFAEVVLLMRDRLRESRFFKLAGIAPTDNAFYSDANRPVKFQAFCVGDVHLVMPSTPRFDDNLRLKEDYDFTLQHVAEYGGIVRCDDVLASFSHRSNSGGAVSYRDAKREQEAIAYLKKKWGSVVRDNPRRENEILLRFARS